MTGLYVMLAVISIAGLFGLVRRHTDGRMRPTGAGPGVAAGATAVRDPAPEAPDVLAPPGSAPDAPDVLAYPGSAPRVSAGSAPDASVPDAPDVLASPGSAPGVSAPGASVLGQSAAGSSTPAETAPAPPVSQPPASLAADVLAESDLAAPLGERATLVQFSSAFCAPCRTTRVVLADVAATVPGVSHVEIDAEARLDLVRRLDVSRTPTVLLLDAAGRIRNRAVGAPRRADVLAALGTVV